MNSAPQLTSNYVLSPMTRSEVVATARRVRTSNLPTAPSIDSVATAHVTTEFYGVPSDPSLDLNLNLSSCTNSTDIPASVDDDVDKHPKNHPIFNWNALCVQAVLYPIIVVIYLLVGAAVFTSIEHGHEKMTRTNEQIAIEEWQQSVEAILRNLNLPENTSKGLLDNFTYLCVDYSRIQNVSYQWEFLPSLYFAATVITTIGEAYDNTSCHMLQIF